MMLMLPSLKLFLVNVTDIENGRIMVRDNGVGMKLETVLGAWLQPGTDIKKKVRAEKRRTSIFGRSLLGEKGVGRFAA